MVTFPSHRVDTINKEKSRIVHIKFETNLIEKMSTDSWPCQKEDVNDYCLEEVVEAELRCYLPWGLGMGVGKYRLKYSMIY